MFGKFNENSSIVTTITRQIQGISWYLDGLFVERIKVKSFFRVFCRKMEIYDKCTKDPWGKGWEKLRDGRKLGNVDNVDNLVYNSFLAKTGQERVWIKSGKLCTVRMWILWIKRRANKDFVQID